MSNLELLSILTPERHEVELDFLGKTIAIRPYTHGDTKAFLEIIEQHKNKRKGASKKLLQAQRDLTNKCVIADESGEKINVSDINRADYVKLFIALKNHTRGESQLLQFRCTNENCEDDTKQRHIESIDFSFDDCTLDKNDISKEITIVVNGKNITFHMNDYTFVKMIQNSDLFEMDIPNFQTISRFQASFIDAIVTDEKTFDSLSMQDKIDFLSQLAPKHQQKISEYIEKQPMWKWIKKWECPVCGAKNISKLEHVQDFFF